MPLRENHSSTLAAAFSEIAIVFREHQHQC
jgi:hypothetical protein